MEAVFLSPGKIKQLVLCLGECMELLEKNTTFNYRKVLYLFFYFCFLFKGWSLTIFPQMDGDILLVLEYVYLLLGCFCWGRNPFSLLTKENLFLFKWIILGIFLSMIPAALYHNQPFFVSLTTYRAQYLWFSLPVLLLMAPTEKEVMRACLLVLFVMWGVYLCKRFMPSLIVVDENAYVDLNKKSYDFGYVPGMAMAIIPLYYYYGRLRECYCEKYLAFFALSFLFLIVMANRSNLFASVIILSVATIGIKTRYRFFYIFLTLVIAAIIFSFTGSYWNDLIIETNSNISNADYNRNKAFAYFIFEGSNHFLTQILGNGFLSSRSGDLMARLMEMGIYNSDMGFIGFWNQFGIIPIVVFVMLPILAIKNRFFPPYLKMLGAHILLCSYSTSYYGAPGHAIIFILFYFLYVYHCTLISCCGMLSMNWQNKKYL